MNKEVVSKIFQLEIGGNRTTEEVYVAGNYKMSAGNVNSQNFPMRKGCGHRKIEIINFGREVTSEEVLVEAKKRGLERPDHEDALFFGEQFPEKQRECPIVFLHKPWEIRYRHFLVIELCMSSVGRCLWMGWFHESWACDCVFAFARK
jgi:hypothetical protein